MSERKQFRARDLSGAWFIFILLLPPTVHAYYSDRLYQNGFSSNHTIHVYYDPAYPSNWISNEDSLFLIKYLGSVLDRMGISIVVVGADHLAKLLAADAVKILVMAQDIAPYSIWSGSGDSILVKWVRKGGILVWSGDVELWYIGYPNGSKHAVGDQTHLLYDSNVVGFVDAEKCKVKIEEALIPDIELPIHSARPVIGGNSVLEVFGSCLVGGVKYYDPALLKAGKGLVLRAFMTAGETDIVVRAAAIAKMVAEKFLGIAIDFQKLRKISYPRIVIGAYHNWYSTGPVWFHWSWHGPGPKRDPEKIVDGRRELASASYPLVGPYDSRDDRLIEYHIRIAKASGIDVFAIDWYGPNSFEDSSINKYLDMAAKLNFSVAIEYEPKIRVEWGSGPREYRVNMVISDLRYVLSRYANHPAYLRIGGKPVIFYYSSAFQLKLGEWDYVFDRLKAEGFDAIHITDHIDPHLLAVFDCIHEWEPLWIENVNITAWDRLREVSYILREYSKLYPDKCFLAGVWPGFDSVGVYGWGGGVRKYDRLDGKVFEEQWKVVLETNPDMVMITTFNDWNEGTEIEPSMEHGFKYMNLTRTYSWLFKGEQPPAYEKPSTSVTPLIDGDILKIMINNRGDIVAVRAEVELKDSYAGTFLSYVQPSDRSKMVAIVPYIGMENYVFTIVMNKTIANATVPVTIDFYDIIGNPYRQRLFIIGIARITAKTTTTTETVTTRLIGTITQISTLTQTTTQTTTAASDQHGTTIGYITAVASLLAGITIGILIRKILPKK